MDSYTYCGIPYAQCTNYTYPGETANFASREILERLVDKVTPEPCPVPYLEPCWHWQGTPQRLLYSRHLDRYVPVKHVAFAWAFSDDFERVMQALRARHGRRLVYKSINRCGMKSCVRPDHHIPHATEHYMHWINPPMRRDPRHPRDPWLTLPELQHLRALLWCQSGDPDFVLQKLSDKWNFNFYDLGDTWNNLKLEEEHRFYSHVVNGDLIHKAATVR